MQCIGVNKAGHKFPCRAKKGQLVEDVDTLISEDVKVVLSEENRRLSMCKFSDKIIPKESCLSWKVVWPI